MDQEIKNKIDIWLNGAYDQETKNIINNLVNSGNTEELTDSFYKDLEFGTGGLRGIMGVGSNRMNKYTIGAATQGFSNYINKNFPNSPSAVIAYDSRNNSDVFSNIVADVFSANGIKVFLFKDLRPTPELSFAIRHLKASAGVVLTASHNPKEYNGYKAYWSDGSQLIAPHDENVINEVRSVKTIDDIKFKRNESLVEIIGQDIDNAYLDTLKALSVFPEVIQRQKDLKIVYSPIHGTGAELVPDVLKKFGFTNVHLVEEQAKPDGNFPTVVYPNPEEAEALTLALKKAKEIDADLVMATDPDADRVGIAVKNDKGEFQLLNGNQTGSLLIAYMLKAWKEANKLTGKEYIVKTIVTSELMDAIAKSYNVECLNVLTGFKFIAGVIREREASHTFIVGGEESYGYLVGSDVRDKDAIASCAFISEMAAYAKDSNRSLFEMLKDIYVEFGFYKENLISITKKGKSGAEDIQNMMKNFRENPPLEINGSKLITIHDYENQETTDVIKGIKNKIDLPKSNVLQFITEDGSKISARPSGTEPKIKFYFSVYKKLAKKEDFHKTEEELNTQIENIISSLQLR